ncbi:hypothetical protein AVEN_89216-1 [Araneus ventricosus]|uniref:Uncharacterized protein n=1 Tax=Araneus ventricosus TaxID=182803 RepID=A0A4Y2KES1_ARAVE|nr:hypothetical protein AVEN_5954-1 [Araneus ventricosus]GBN00867.1 hypothetical protein AVEN_89216-1 [Araneus ventricosus]
MIGEFSLVTLTSRFEVTRGLFWDGPRNFELLSDDEDDTSAGTSSPNFHTTPTGGRLAITFDLMFNKPTYTADLQWNRVSNLEPSGPKAETLPLGHRGLHDRRRSVGFLMRIMEIDVFLQKIT